MARRPFDIKAQPGFGFMALVTFFALYLPIAALVAYSFNAADSLSRWDGFSLRWFISAWHNSAVQDASVRSLVLAVSAAAISTIAATMAALATTRTPPYPGLTFKYAAINATVGATIAEFVGSDRGLGFYIQIETGNMRPDLAFGAIFLLTMLGLALFGLVTLVERLVIPWDIGQRRSRTQS